MSAVSVDEGETAGTGRGVVLCVFEGPGCWKKEAIPSQGGHQHNFNYSTKRRGSEWKGGGRRGETGFNYAYK